MASKLNNDPIERWHPSHVLLSLEASEQIFSKHSQVILIEIQYSDLLFTVKFYFTSVTAWHAPD